MTDDTTTEVVEAMDDPTAFQQMVGDKDQAMDMLDRFEEMVNSDNDQWAMNLVLERDDIPALRDELHEMMTHDAG